MHEKLFIVFLMFVVGLIIIQFLVFPIYYRASKRTNKTVVLYMLNLVDRKKYLTTNEKNKADTIVILTFIAVFISAMILEVVLN